MDFFTTSKTCELGPVPVAVDWTFLVLIAAAALFYLPILAFFLRREVARIDPKDVLRDL